MKDLHINVLELHAIWLVPQAFEDILQDSNVAILCSNVSAICLSVKTGGHSVSKMCHTAIYSCDWTGKRSLTLMPRSCPEHLYVLAVI